MVMPRLLHPVAVVIEKSDKANSFYDADRREPIRSVKRIVVNIQAQVRYRRLGEPDPKPEGLTEDVDGWLTVTQYDLDGLAYLPAMDDKIVTIGAETTELYILQPERQAYYSDQGGNTLRRLYFRHKRPSADLPRF